MVEKSEYLYYKGYYLVGDSASALKSFIIIPYDHAEYSSTHDTFNFYHSSCRIYVECAFGEIDMGCVEEYWV